MNYANQSLVLPANKKRSFRFVISLLVFSLFSQAAGAGADVYTFLTNQSTVVQVGGRGIYETYPIGGQFWLSVDFDAGVASFEVVDANLLEPSGFLFTQDLDELFNMTELAGTIVDDSIIEFQGNAVDDVYTDIRFTLTFIDDSVHLVGEVNPHCVDCYYYDLEAVARRKFAAGTGEPNDPFLIYTPEQMNAIGNEPNNLDKHFRLMADIDLSEFIGTDFNIIGSSYNSAFSGTFDGQGHIIRNFTFTNQSKDIVGLFGCISRTSEIRNIDLVDANIVGKSYVGSLVGYSNGGSVSNCNVTGNVQAWQYTGGMIGINMNKALTQNCCAIVNVSGSITTGGLVGANSTSYISNCFVDGSISGSSITGGITGRQDYGTVSNSFSSCVVSGRGDMIGGLVGRNNYSLVSGCYATGEVRGDEMVGGLVGFSDSDISNCYSSARVVGSNNVGGLLGYNIYGYISYSYSTGEVTGGGNVGALLGYDYGTCFYTSCFWNLDIQPSFFGISNAVEPDIVGITTKQMKRQKTFTTAGWDFVDETKNGTEDIWWILEDQDYPRLWWELNVDGSMALTEN
jgi:hypothetical protein